MNIIAGTTPTIGYTFSTIDVLNIVTAIFSVKQNEETIIEKYLGDAVIGENKLSWTLSQAETLMLSPSKSTRIYLDYVLNDGTRGAGATESATISKAGKNEVI